MIFALNCKLWLKMVMQWIWKRIVSDENVGYLLEKVEPRLDDIIKDRIFNVLEDEEIAKWIVSYGDNLFDRYKRKVFSTIGGIQKGVNYAVREEAEDAFGIPLDEDGMPSVSKILMNLARNYFKNRGQQQQNIGNEAQIVPEMS